MCCSATTANKALSVSNSKCRANSKQHGCSTMSSWSSCNHRFAFAALMLALVSEGAAMVTESPTRGLLGGASRIRIQRTEGAATLLSAAREKQRQRLKEIGADSEGLYSSLLEAKLSAQNNAAKRSWTEALFGEDEDELDALTAENLAERVREEASTVADLQTATGSEIPDMELHLQMEAARKRSGTSKGQTGSTAAAFIDGHVADATNMEKVAMSSLPLQLPGPAASVIDTVENNRRKAKVVSARKAPVQKNVSKRSVESVKPIRRVLSGDATPGIKSISTKDVSAIMSAKKFSTQRVSREEEIELARIVQQGSELQRMKTDFEEEHGRDITRQEWADLADLESPKELRRLVSTYRSAKNKLVTANMGLVHAVVRSQYGAWARQRGITLEELVQEGSLGLIRAAELFDPSRGLRFSTYATIWIKGILSNSKVDEIISLPAREKTKWNKIRKASADMIRENGNVERYKPKAREVAMRTGLNAEEVESVTRKMNKAHNLMSLDYKYENQGRSGTDSSRGDLHNDRALHADSDLVERLQLRADVIAALARNLDPREARLMRLRYGLKDGISRSLTECAEAMGISYETARRLSLQCLKKLREADDADSLQE